VKSAGAWKRISLMGTIIERKHPSLLLRFKRGSVNKWAVLKFLRDLKAEMAGRKLLLFWDGLAAHRAKIVSQFIFDNKKWLSTERFPAYAPELNPVEYLWSSLKKHAGNGEPSIDGMKRQARKARRRLSNERLLKGFLRASKLYS